jgi:ribosomal protein S18 acetylase RimI-like enzyme
MLVRRATGADLDAILPLVRGYREFYLQAHDAERERAFMERNLREGRSVVYVAQDGGRLAGFVQLFPAWSTVYLGPSLILEDLFVEPGARGGGVASALLARALEHAQQAGATGMFLETAVDNVAAQRVYERGGWTREGRFLKFNAPL